MNLETTNSIEWEEGYKTGYAQGYKDAKEKHGLGPWERAVSVTDRMSGASDEWDLPEWR